MWLGVICFISAKMETNKLQSLKKCPTLFQFIFLYNGFFLDLMSSMTYFFSFPIRLCGGEKFLSVLGVGWGELGSSEIGCDWWL